jgi:hypothetical protein
MVYFTLHMCQLNSLDISDWINILHLILISKVDTGLALEDVNLHVNQSGDYEFEIV